MRKWYVVFALGAAFALIPGMLDPLAVINGSTLLGLGLLVWASLKMSGIAFGREESDRV
jgi:lipoprotein signal peptidase